MANEKTPNAAAERPSEEYLKQYARLRTVLDSLESMALHYCLAKGSDKERIKRVRKIERLVKPVATEVMALSKADEGRSGGGDPCPPGYCLCDGVCVPYPC